MALKIKPKYTKSNSARPTDDQHPALIAQIIDIGSQFKRDWQTQAVEVWKDGNPKINQEVIITFEFPTQKAEFDGEMKPLWVSKRYNISVDKETGDLNSKSGLFELARAAGMKTKDLSELGGKCTLVDVGSTSTGNAKIISVSPAKSKVLVNDEVLNVADFKLSKGSCIIYDMDNGHDDVYTNLPNYIKGLIDNQASKEQYKAEQEGKSEAPEDSVSTESETEY